MADYGSEPLIEALALVAPGTPLRNGIDRILQSKGGALVLVGDDPAVLSICTGGFLLDSEFSPQRLSELAKMDGAIILTADATRIARANVHLIPKSSIPTSETGTRHRTAERVARSLDVPVISVSEEMATVAVYRHQRKHTLDHSGRLVERASQAISTVQRFRTRFSSALAALSTLEMADSVSVGDVVAVLQPGAMMRHFIEEIEGYLVELGEDGQLIRLQIQELGTGLEDTLRLVLLDYVPIPDSVRGRPSGWERRRDEHQLRVSRALAVLGSLGTVDLMDPGRLATGLEFGTGAGVLDTALEARGFRLLHRIPRVSDTVIERIVDRFTTLTRIMQATIGELEQIEGVGNTRAKALKSGLSRLVETSIFEGWN